MARRIPSGISDVNQLGTLVDSELQRLTTRTQTAFVGATRLPNSNESYLFTDSTGLKFYNATTKTVQSVKLE